MKRPLWHIHTGIHVLSVFKCYRLYFQFSGFQNIYIKASDVSETFYNTMRSIFRKDLFPTMKLLPKFKRAILHVALWFIFSWCEMGFPTWYEKTYWNVMFHEPVNTFWSKDGYNCEDESDYYFYKAANIFSAATQMLWI